MTAIFLVWNQDREDDWNYTSLVEQVQETGQSHKEWRVAGAAGIAAAGSDAWLLLRGKHWRGLLGHGVVISAEPCAGPRSGIAGAPSSRLIVAFDSLLPLGDQLGPELLSVNLPAVVWDDLRNGQAMDPAAEARIRDLWRLEGPAPIPETTFPLPGSYPSWAVSTVVVNRYERDPEARRACIAHYGTSCAACGFSFEIVYGEAGRDFIDVHHTVPVSMLDSNYLLDPVTDLVPLCANCHAMAHIGVSAPRALSELRQMLAGAGFMRGQTLRPAEVESQNEALRILGPARGDPGHPPAPER
jgi:5-methylcytosine-specific restriction protein A